MTNIHTLSDSELNEVIARAKGWEVVNGMWHYENDSYVQWCDKPHDYTHDSGLAMALLEEMGQEILGFSLTIFSSDMKWVCNGIMKSGKLLETDNCDAPQRAICEAFAEWKGL